MRNIPVIFLLFLLLTGCSNIISISKNEDKGIKDAVDFYGGYCEYAIGASLSTEDGKKKYFELKMSKSEVIEKYADMSEMVASNTAYIFFKDLQGEKKNYDEIHSELDFEKRPPYKATYTIDELETFDAKMNVVNKIVNLIKAKDFKKIKPFLSSGSYSEADQNKLISDIQNADTTFGNVKEFRLFGFQKQTINGYDVLTVFGAMMRDKQNNQLCIKIDLKPGEDKIHYLDYKF